MPLIVHSTIAQVLDEATDAQAIVGALVLLATLLFVGIAMDNRTLREADDGTRLSLGVYRVLSARPVVTVATTLVIPLLTGGLALWKQIDEGIGTSQQACVTTQANGNSSSGSTGQAAAQGSSGSNGSPDCVR